MLVATIFLGLVCGSLAQDGCTIVVNSQIPMSQTSSPALLLKPGGSHDGFGFLLPTDSQDTITMRPGEQVLVACPGPRNYIIALQPEPVVGSSLVHEAVVTCASNNRFSSDLTDHTVFLPSCTSNPHHTARKTNKTCTDSSGNKIGVMLEVGFELKMGFYKLIDICFDETLKNPRYTKFDLVSNIGSAQHSSSHGDYSEGEPSLYEDLDPKTLYAEVRFNYTVSHLLDPRKKYYHSLLMGQLTGSGDFVFRYQQRTTMYFANVVPQWRIFKFYSWDPMEASVRRFAVERKLNLEVYTGTHGVLTVLHRNKVYLSDNGVGKRFIPVPYLLWKVVYDPKTKAGVAIIGVNNPHFMPGKFGKLDTICPDISHTVTWLRQDSQHPDIYCCDVNRFNKVVKLLPRSVVVNKLLV